MLQAATKIDGMNLKKRGNVWWLVFVDHKKQRREMSTRTRIKRIADKFATTISRILDFKCGGSAPDMELIRWVRDDLDESRRKQLIHWDVITEEHILSSKAVSEHIDDWYQYLLRGNTDEHARTCKLRVQKIADEVEAVTVDDLSGDKVSRALRNLRSQIPKMNRDGKPEYRKLSVSSQNHYLTAVKMFCLWTVRHRRAAMMPAGLELIKKTKVTKPAVVRRSLTPDEQAALMSTEPRRRRCYLLGLYAGLRTKEILTLEDSDIDYEGRAIYLRAANTKNGKDDVVRISSWLADQLYSMRHLGPYDLGVSRHYWAQQTRADAGEVEDIDFHCLRHTFCTMLADKGVHPKVAQKMARHSKIEITMGYYTHIGLDAELAAAEAISPEMKDEERA